MKLNYRFAALTLSLVAVSAWAGEADSLMVNSTQKAQGATVMAGKAFYTKDFDIVLANLSKQAVNLHKICLDAQSADGKHFKLDSIGSELAQGTLGPSKVVKGRASFASDDTSVYSAVLVKATVCP